VEIERIETMLQDHYPQLAGFHRLRTRQAGPERYVDLHIEVPGDLSVVDSHRLCDHLEEELRRMLPGAQILIHVEPRRSDG
jgi:divalent metal cation (Fe/Co/Zn/Cd) transporter